MKLLALTIIAATSGTCSVGGQRALPPSPAEQEAAAQSKPKPAAAPTSDPWSTVTPECRALGDFCGDCGDVEMMRRRIEFKKCLPVCLSYVDRTAQLTAVSEDALNVLREPNACGKRESTCSPVEETRCEYMVGYVTTGELFRARWLAGEVAPAVLAEQFHADFLGPVLDHHSRVVRWAESNEVPPAPLLVVGGDLFGITAQGLVSDVTARLSEEGAEEASVISSLVELARFPGDPVTFSARRASLEEVFRTR